MPMTEIEDARLEADLSRARAVRDQIKQLLERTCDECDAVLHDFERATALWDATVLIYFVCMLIGVFYDPFFPPVWFHFVPVWSLLNSALVRAKLDRCLGKLEGIHETLVILGFMSEVSPPPNGKRKKKGKLFSMIERVWASAKQQKREEVFTTSPVGV
jgi:hypothetical protein